MPIKCGKKLYTFHNSYYSIYPDATYKFKVNNKNTKKMCEICLKLTIKTPENVNDAYCKDFHACNVARMSQAWVPFPKKVKNVPSFGTHFEHFWLFFIEKIVPLPSRPWICPATMLPWYNPNYNFCLDFSINFGQIPGKPIQKVRRFGLTIQKQGRQV